MESTDLQTAANRKAKSRAAMHAAMLDLLEEKPFEQIQITELTARAGVGYATFFRHFSSTQELLDEVAGDEIDALLALTVPIGRSADTGVGTLAVCNYVYAHRQFWRAILAGGAAHSVRAEFVRQAREWAARYDAADAHVPIDLGTVCAAGSTIDALGWWLERIDDFSVEEMAAFIDRLIIRPFVGPIQQDRT